MCNVFGCPWQAYQGVINQGKEVGLTEPCYDDHEAYEEDKLQRNNISAKKISGCAGRVKDASPFQMDGLNQDISESHLPWMFYYRASHASWTADIPIAVHLPLAS